MERYFGNLFGFGGAALCTPNEMSASQSVLCGALSRDGPNIGLAMAALRPSTSLLLGSAMSVFWKFKIQSMSNTLLPSPNMVVAIRAQSCCTSDSSRDAKVSNYFFKRPL